MNAKLRLALIIVALPTLVACGPATRTADGDCYYQGKGLLALGATLLDNAVAYGYAKQEKQYQENQIALQKLGAALDEVDVDALQSDDEINAYNEGVDEYNQLLDEIEEHQELKQRILEIGGIQSFSKKVDNSGNCPP